MGAWDSEYIGELATRGETNSNELRDERDVNHVESIPRGNYVVKWTLVGGRQGRSAILMSQSPRPFCVLQNLFVPKKKENRKAVREKKNWEFLPPLTVINIMLLRSDSI